jgi:hydrogenase nickel insertion protein HypA
MHEVTLAREIAEAIIREAENANAKRVLSVELELGDLAFLDPDNIEIWVREALAEGPGKDAVLKISMARSSLTCNACGFSGVPDIPEDHDHHLPLPTPYCPRCRSDDVQLDGQTGCILKRIELEV